MKNLKDLKEDILNNKIEKFYVFYGEDYGIRKHYINKLSTFFEETRAIDSMDLISNQQRGSGLFSVKTLYIIHGDIIFARKKSAYIQSTINKLKDDAVVLVYENELPNSPLFKDFSDYITYFPVVQDKIAYQFIDSEVRLSLDSKKELAYNCKNNYNNILLEADKIRNYAEAKNISYQIAYEELQHNGQLLYEYDTFNINEFMNDVLKGNFKNMDYWTTIITKNYKDQFWMSLSYIFTDYLIAYFIVKYGKYEGSTYAYNCGLNWGRIKSIREFVIPYSAKSLLETANDVADLDMQIKFGKLQQDDLYDRFLCTIM